VGVTFPAHLFSLLGGLPFFFSLFEWPSFRRLVYDLVEKKLNLTCFSPFPLFSSFLFPFSAPVTCAAGNHSVFDFDRAYCPVPPFELCPLNIDLCLDEPADLNLSPPPGVPFDCDGTLACDGSFSMRNDLLPFADQSDRSLSFPFLVSPP